MRFWFAPFARFGACASVPTRPSGWAIVTLLIASLASDLSTASAQSQPTAPVVVPNQMASKSAAAEVAKVLEAHFAKKPGYRPGDLVGREDLREIALRLADAGLMPAGGIDDLEARIPSETAEIRKLLSGKDGQRFMRQIARMPGGYKQFDNLANLPTGGQFGRDMVEARGGDEIIAYLTGTKGGQRLSRSLARHNLQRAGRQPPPRIYTQDDLEKALTQLYAPKR